MSRTFSFVIQKTDVQTEIGNRFPSSGTSTAILNKVFGTNNNVAIRVDRGFSRAVSHRVLTSNYGDGYSQRVRDGINSKIDSFTVSFNNRDWEEIEVIAAFLDLKVALNFTVTVAEEAIKVKCEEYNISYGQQNVHSIQATFMRVYEPV